VIWETRIVKDHHLDGVPITPEMFVVGFNCCADIAQSIAWNNKNIFGKLHTELVKNVSKR
jgi:hypothetical protein